MKSRRKSQRKRPARRRAKSFQAKPLFTSGDLHRIDLALLEDLGRPRRDRTTQTVLKGREKTVVSAHILSKEQGTIVLCGLEIAREVFRRLSPACRLETAFQDGEHVASHEVIATIHGPIHAILAGERTALNFLQRLSAIATLTHRFVEQVKGTALKILDTRKTTPCLRHFEKYAVFCGGGVNHRMGLYDAILVKNNHIDAVGGVRNALAKLPRAKANDSTVVFEVRSPDELKDVLAHGQGKVHRALLDNMSIDELRQCAALAHGRLETEASGGIHLENIANIAATGVDYASIGQLTHSAGSVDLALHIDGKP